MDALIGATGFVGSNLAVQKVFDLHLHSRNIGEIDGRELGLVVCAGVPAAKWIANAKPDEDRATIEGLKAHLAAADIRKFVLISTVDVFGQPIGRAEDDASFEDPKLTAYGRHRLELEQWVAAHFADHLIVRLPALFGPHLKKNYIFDLLRNHETYKIVPNSSFQWYPVTRLWQDIERLIASPYRLAQLVTQPIKTQAIIGRFFPDRQVAPPAEIAPSYDLWTRFAPLFGKHGHYMMEGDEVLAEMDAFLRPLLGRAA